MRYDELTLRPPTGAIDVAAVNAWLGSQPHSFFDPVEGDGWHLSGTAQEMEKNRAERIADPTRFPSGVRVYVLPDRVVIAKWIPMAAEVHMLEFVRWLVRDGGWTVGVDHLSPWAIHNACSLISPANLITQSVRLQWVCARRGRLMTNRSSSTRAASGERRGVAAS
jgi:hypothetical protein